MNPRDKIPNEKGWQYHSERQRKGFDMKYERVMYENGIYRLSERITGTVEEAVNKIKAILEADRKIQNFLCRRWL